MPSLRLKRPRSTWPDRARWLPLLLLVACAGPAQRPDLGPAPRVRHDEFLLAPTTGYNGVLPLEQAEALEVAYRGLILGGAAESALSVARSFEEGPAAAPAGVLAAQAHYVLGRCDAALERLAEITANHASYVAADLLLGRCREDLADLPGAAEAYHRASGVSPLAAARLAHIGPRARDMAVVRIQGWLEGGLMDEARQGIGSLERWAPRDTETLEAIRQLAEQANDPRLELQTARALTQGGGNRDLLARRAELELEVGDSGEGLRILEELVAQDPSDESLIQGLERARFAWRMSMLPRPAQAAATSPELNRADLATLLYWVFPSVRYGRPSEAVIANDIFDHEHRTEIVRIVNLGIMEIDPNLHAFRPEAPARRLDALRGLLRVLRQGRETQQCLGGTTVDSRLSIESTCSLAARCGLLDEPADCLPEAVLSGSSVMTMARNTAGQLETR